MFAHIWGMNEFGSNDNRQKYSSESLENYLLDNQLYFELANFYRAQKNYIDAIYYLKKQLRRSDAIAYKLNLVDCYIEQGSFEQALIFVNQALEQVHNKGELHYIISILKIECLINSNRIDTAFMLIDELFKYYKAEEEIYAWQAVAYLKTNQVENAKNSYAECVRLNPLQERAWLGLGSVHCIKGDYELGLSCFKRVLDINPTHFAAHKMIQKYRGKTEHE